jgi:hypothetical protein
MLKNLLMFLGLRKAAKTSFMRRNGAMLAPVGGVVPAIAWLAWQNREKLQSMYKQYVAPKINNLRPIDTSAIPRPSRPSYSAAI